MTTIAESTTSLGGMMDGIADGLLNNHGTEWSEPDADITNDQSTEDWTDNARLLQHSTSGIYFLMYVTYQQGFDAPNSNSDVGGVRFIFSDGWNTTDNHPAGKTTVQGKDPMSGQVSNQLSNSFASAIDNNDNEGFGIWVLDKETNAYNPSNVSSRSDAATLVDATWFASVGADHISVGAYNTADAGLGSASWSCWEHTDSKFWGDGNVPFMAATGFNHQGYRVIGCYSFEWWESHAGSSNFGLNYTDSGAWGYINPDSNDDTYFFRRPILYTSAGTPLGYVTSFIPNQTTEGSSGDTISYNGTDYRLFQETGASKNTIPAVGLRFT